MLSIDRLWHEKLHEIRSTLHILRHNGDSLLILQIHLDSDVRVVGFSIPCVDRHTCYWAEGDRIIIFACISCKRIITERYLDYFCLSEVINLAQESAELRPELKSLLL